MEEAEEKARKKREMEAEAEEAMRVNVKIPGQYQSIDQLDMFSNGGKKEEERVKVENQKKEPKKKEFVKFNIDDANKKFQKYKKQK